MLPVFADSPALEMLAGSGLCLVLLLGVIESFRRVYSKAASRYRRPALLIAWIFTLLAVLQIWSAASWFVPGLEPYQAIVGLLGAVAAVLLLYSLRRERTRLDQEDEHLDAQADKLSTLARHLNQEISQRRETERDLAAQGMLLRLITNQVPGGVSYIDRNRVFVFVNSHVMRRLALRRDEVVGACIDDLMPDDEREQIGEAVSNALAGRAQRMLMQLAFDGHRRWYRVDMRPDVDVEGRVRGATVLSVDVHDSVLAQEQKEQAEAEVRLMVEQRAERLERDLQKQSELAEWQSDFLAMISHELKTPASSLRILASQLIRQVARLGAGSEDGKERLRNEVQEKAAKIGAVSHKLAQQLNDLLDCNRLEDLSSSQETFDLAAALQSARDALDEDDRSRLIVDPQTGFAVVGEQQLIAHAIQNLLVNGLKYSPADKPVTVEIAQAEENAIITVLDRGPGIPEHELQHLFEKWRRGSTSQGTKGSGFGLHLVKRIVEAHGGEIRVDSLVGLGTRMCIALPLARSNRIAAQDPSLSWQAAHLPAVARPVAKTLSGAAQRESFAAPVPIGSSTQSAPSALVALPAPRRPRHSGNAETLAAPSGDPMAGAQSVPRRIPHL